MGGNIPPEVFQAYMEQQRAADARAARMTARTVLAEMVRQEVAEKPLAWRRRKALVRFAEKLGLDAYEADLLIRAAEYSSGKGLDQQQAATARAYLAELDEPARQWANIWTVLAVLALNSALVVSWMRWRG